MTSWQGEPAATIRSCPPTAAAEFEALTRAAPTKTPSELITGLDGGNCDMEFDGSGGYAKLTTFIAIHTSGEAAARAMYDDFRKNDGERSGPGTDLTVTDVQGLGTAAYLYRQHGSLVLTDNGRGYAREADGWPASEEDLKAKVRKITKDTMKTLKG